MLKEDSFWTDNVVFVYNFYIQCDLFDLCIFNYEIIPATVANTFLLHQHYLKLRAS